jgi:predicted nucleic acid-binding protein
MDLLIGAAAVADGAPLVTRNRRHFERIEALDLIDY